MNARRHRHVITAACILALVALGLMVWSLFDPRPIPVIAAMSVGQLLGTLSFAAFLFVVFVELRARLRLLKKIVAHPHAPPTTNPAPADSHKAE
jgi:hypothetical protein